MSTSNISSSSGSGNDGDLTGYEGRLSSDSLPPYTPVDIPPYVTFVVTSLLVSVSQLQTVILALCDASEYAHIARYTTVFEIAGIGAGVSIENDHDELQLTAADIAETLYGSMQLMQLTEHGSNDWMLLTDVLSEMSAMYEGGDYFDAKDWQQNEAATTTSSTAAAAADSGASPRRSPSYSPRLPPRSRTVINRPMAANINFLPASMQVSPPPLPPRRTFTTTSPPARPLPAPPLPPRRTQTSSSLSPPPQPQEATRSTEQVEDTETTTTTAAEPTRVKKRERLMAMIAVLAPSKIEASLHSALVSSRSYVRDVGDSTKILAGKKVDKPASAPAKPVDPRKAKKNGGDGGGDDDDTDSLAAENEAGFRDAAHKGAQALALSMSAIPIIGKRFGPIATIAWPLFRVVEGLHTLSFVFFDLRHNNAAVREVMDERGPAIVKIIDRLDASLEKAHGRLLARSPSTATLPTRTDAPEVVADAPYIEIFKELIAELDQFTSHLEIIVTNLQTDARDLSPWQFMSGGVGVAAGRLVSPNPLFKPIELAAAAGQSATGVLMFPLRSQVRNAAKQQAKILKDLRKIQTILANRANTAALSGSGDVELTNTVKRSMMLEMKATRHELATLRKVFSNKSK